MYRSIRIKNFRGLRDLAIEDLGRVNLIVGENGAGKTSLLEALWLLQNAGDAIQSASFGEVRGSRFASLTADDNWPLLFHDLATDAPISIVATERDGLQTSLRLGPGRSRSYWYRRDAGNTGRPSSLREAQEPYASNTAAIGFPHGIFVSAHREATVQELAVRYILAKESAQLDQIVHDLQAVLPNLRGLALDYGPAEEGPPVIVADVGLAQPLPLPLLGDGTAHLLELLLAIRLAASGVALIDEVALGLYHRHLVDMWGAINRASHDRSTQVFATTHSWECIAAAITGFAGEHAGDFRLHRLERTPNGPRVITYTHEVAQAAFEINIEVR